MEETSIETVFVTDVGTGAGIDIRIELRLGVAVGVDAAGVDALSTRSAVWTASNGAVLGVDRAVGAG